MHAMVVDLRVRPGDTEEMVRIYRGSVMSAARRQPGFRGALLLTDPEKFSDFLTETPVRKHYEVSILEQVWELIK